MKRYLGVFASISVNLFIVLSLFLQDEFMLNLVSAVVTFLFLLHILLFVLFFVKNDEEIKEIFIKIASIEKLSSFVKTIDLIFDIAAIVALFGFGHWWKGWMLVCIICVFIPMTRKRIDECRKQTT
ncbi:MAG: hypothetical protein ACTSX6_08170 [Candidatus Heimdallarchaeaceae archaeon]